jgi:hypothetical protein
MKAIHGGKAKTDKIDAHKIARAVASSNRADTRRTRRRKPGRAVQRRRAEKVSGPPSVFSSSSMIGR